MRAVTSYFEARNHRGGFRQIYPFIAHWLANDGACWTGAPALRSRCDVGSEPKCRQPRMTMHQPIARCHRQIRAYQCWLSALWRPGPPDSVPPHVPRCLSARQHSWAVDGDSLRGEDKGTGSNFP